MGNCTCMDDNVERGFFEIGAYRHNIHRYKDGMEHMNDLQEMLKERIELESVYSKCLQAFHEKWSAVAIKIPTVSIRSAWQDVLDESLELHKLHTNVKERISDEIIKTIALYVKENHHPSAFRAPREIREIEEQFEKVQKPWKKQFEKVEKARKIYHAAAQKEKSALVQKKNAEGDSSVSADGARKYEERWQKYKEEAGKTEEAYKKALGDLDKIRDDYIAHMRDVFESCQQKELKRMKFVFEMLSGLQKVLVDLASATKLNQLHRRLEKDFEKDEERFTPDLKQWARRFGPECRFDWPEFEAYTPALHSIASKKGKTDDCEVVLVRQTTKTEDDSATSLSSASPRSSTKLKNRLSKDIISGPLPALLSNDVQHTEDEAGTSGAHTNGTAKEQEETEVSNGQLSPTSESFDAFDSTPLYSAKVLYDYKPQDHDELSIHAGEVIEVLSGPDPMNWSYGKKNDKKGLFPSQYVERI